MMIIIDDIKPLLYCEDMVSCERGRTCCDMYTIAHKMILRGEY